jgi:hypothetical protein
VHPHKVQQFEQTLILMLLDIKYVVEYFALDILQNHLLDWFILYLDNELDDCEQLVEIELHLIDLPL